MVKVNNLYIPSNIISLELEYINCNSITFSPKSKIKDINFKCVISNTPVSVLPNTIENVTCTRCDINFIECKFNNLKCIKYVKLLKCWTKQFYPWLINAIISASEYVDITTNVKKNTFYIWRAKSVRTQSKFVEDINKNVQTLYLNVNCCKHSSNIFNSFKQVNYLKIYVEQKLWSPIIIKSDSLITLIIESEHYDRV